MYSSFFGRYSMDVIVSCAFSGTMDSSPLITHASKLFKFPMPLFCLQGIPSLFHTVLSLFVNSCFLTEIILIPFTFPACFPILLPLLEMLHFSLFPKDSTSFFKMVVEKIRAERNGSSHQVWINHTTRPMQYE